MKCLRLRTNRLTSVVPNFPQDGKASTLIHSTNIQFNSNEPSDFRFRFMAPLRHQKVHLLSWREVSMQARWVLSMVGSYFNHNCDLQHTQPHHTLTARKKPSAMSCLCMEFILDNKWAGRGQSQLQGCTASPRIEPVRPPRGCYSHATAQKPARKTLAMMFGCISESRRIPSYSCTCWKGHEANPRNSRFLWLSTNVLKWRKINVL